MTCLLRCIVAFGRGVDGFLKQMQCAHNAEMPFHHFIEAIKQDFTVFFGHLRNSGTYVYKKACSHMDMSLARRLADNLRKRRSGKTQEVFARKLGISRVSLTRIENAEQNVSLKTLQQLCKALKCDIGDLF